LTGTGPPYPLGESIVLLLAHLRSMFMPLSVLG